MTTDAVRFHVEPPGARDRWSALFRPILVIPHAILVGGPFVGFGGGAFRALRVEAYGLLIHDRFPSFSLSEEDVGEAALVRQAS